MAIRSLVARCSLKRPNWMAFHLRMMFPYLRALWVWLSTLIAVGAGRYLDRGGRLLLRLKYPLYVWPDLKMSLNVLLLLRLLIFSFLFALRWFDATLWNSLIFKHFTASNGHHAFTRLRFAEQLFIIVQELREWKRTQWSFGKLAAIVRTLRAHHLAWLKRGRGQGRIRGIVFVAPPCVSIRLQFHICIHIYSR